MLQIKQAFHRTVREVHPDFGHGDSELMERVMYSYGVLSDPYTRRQYDELPDGMEWPDDPIVRRELKAIVRSQALQRDMDPDDAWLKFVNHLNEDRYDPANPPEGDIDPKTGRPRRVRRSIAKAWDEESLAAAASMGMPDEEILAVFLLTDDFVELPTREVRYQWVGMIARAMSAIGMVTKVRVGFKSKAPEIIEGVIFVPPAWRPNMTVASAMVSKLRERMSDPTFTVAGTDSQE